MARKKQKPEDIKNILDAVIKKLEKKDGGVKRRILCAWQEAIDEKASHHTRPASIKQKVLTVEVDSSTWLYALSLKKKNTLDKMKQILGKDKILDIRFRMGEIT